MSTTIVSSKRVYLYTVAMFVRPDYREYKRWQLHNAVCINCNMPVLEHVYDANRDIVLHWKGNCGITMNRHSCNQSDRDNPKLICGYPLPCPHHTVIMTEKTITVPNHSRGRLHKGKLLKLQNAVFGPPTTPQRRKKDT